MLRCNNRPKRRMVLERAKEKNRSRWSGPVRNWDLLDKVYLNPPKGKESDNANVA